MQDIINMEKKYITRQMEKKKVNINCGMIMENYGDTVFIKIINQMVNINDGIKMGNYLYTVFIKMAK